MAGLLDMFENPQDAAMLATGLGLLNASGPSRMPVSMGQAIGNAGMQGMAAYQQAEKLKREKLQQDMLMQQLEMAKRKMAQEMKLEQLTNDAISKTLGVMQPTTHEQITGYNFNASPTAQSTLGRNAADQQSVIQSAQALIDRKNKGAALSPDEETFLNDIKGRIEPIKQNVTVQPDMAGTLRNLGTQLAAIKPEVAKVFLTASERYEPRKMDANSFYENRLTGKREFIGDPTKGITYGPNGVEIMPGAENIARLEAMKAGATTSAQKSAEAPYAEPVVLKGVGHGGADVVIPRVNMPGMNGVMQARSPIGMEGEKEFNANWIKNTYQPIQDSATSADKMLTQVQTFRNIKLDTGWGTETKAGAANILTGLGIAPENAKLYAANAQKFQQVAMDRLWVTLNAAKGPQTEGDADRAKKTFISLANTPQANQFIADLAEATARRDKLKASFYQDAYQLAKQSGDFGRVDNEWRGIQRSIWDDPIMAKWKGK